MNKNKTFKTSIILWLTQNIFAIIFMACALLILLLVTQVLRIDASIEYNYYVKILIILCGYIGIIIGTHKAFYKIRDSNKYLSKGTKYLVALYQIILISAIGFICYTNKVNYIIFIGLYLTLFIQFLLNYYYTKFNNYKYPLNKKVYQSNDKPNNNSENNIIDINNLK